MAQVLGTMALSWELLALGIGLAQPQLVWLFWGNAPANGRFSLRVSLSVTL